MNEFDRENKGHPDFVTRFTERPDGIYFDLQLGEGDGNVSLSTGPHKCLADAQAAATKIVREILRRRIQAAGIARRGERPAFGGATCRACGSDCLPHKTELCWPCWQLANPYPQSEPPPLQAPAPRRPYTPPALTKVPAPQLADVVGGPAGELAEGPSWMEKPPASVATTSEPLEDEQLCTCDHTDGVHVLGVNQCALRGCSCGEFELVARVEDVASSEVH